MVAAVDTLMRFPLDEQLVVVARTGLGALCGLLIGLERQLAHKIVGLRTHMLVAAAAALATGMGELLFAESGAGDPPACCTRWSRASASSAPGRSSAAPRARRA